MFEVSSLHVNTRLQTLSLLADSSVDNTATDRSKRQPVAAWVRRHCGSASRTHAACVTPQIVYNRRGLDPDCWGHNSGKMKSGVSLSFTVNLWLCLHMNRKAYLACNFDFRVETERFHKVACKQIRLTLQKRQCLRNNASYRRYTIRTVNRKWPMAHKVALFQMSLSDRWGHSPTAGLFKCVFRTFM